jgi:prevent-host-death family protein
MPRRISATEARVHFGAVLRNVAEEGETYMVERTGKQIAVVLPVAEYERLISTGEKPRWKALLDESDELFRSFHARNPNIDWAEVIREGREERDRQLSQALFGCERCGEDDHEDAVIGSPGARE